MRIHWLNRALNWRVEERDGGFYLYNQFGYSGRYESLRDALANDALMSCGPFDA